MKRLYFFLTIILFSAVVNAQIVDIPDPNFKAILLAANPGNTIASNFDSEYIKIDANNDGEIQLAEALQVRNLYVSSASISSLIGIGSFTNIFRLDCSGNLIQHFDAGLLNIPSTFSLNILDCSYNQIETIAINFPIQNLVCHHNQITVLSIDYPQSIVVLNCSYNQLTDIDASGMTGGLQELYCDYNDLRRMNLKNGRLTFGYRFNNNPNLEYICVDEFEITQIQNRLNQYGYVNCHINSYCSFSPGGAFYTINGNIKYDTDNDGCSPLDVNYPHLQLSFSNGTTTGHLIPDETGNYSYDVQQGMHSITPVLENPFYFSVSPETTTVAFPATTNPFTQDFCVSANGTHNDLEILLFSSPAGPGFDVRYVAVYKNKGTTTQSGIVSLAFDDTVSDFVSSIPTVSNQTLNSLSWSFSNLLPFEKRVITFVLRVNSPVETPPVNSGDVLHYVATVTGATDESPADNTITMNQVVTNSVDPNDKVCLEGNTVGIDMINQYVHYMIRFENTGTANAQNIVVKDIIDSNKFEVSSLIPLQGSHPFVTRIASNKVEFIFENINLPYDDANNDGYVTFKIKTIPTLVLGDTFSNTANIYFDYNFPIITNTSTTTIIQMLGNQDVDFNTLFSLSPVPTKDLLIVTTKQAVTISSISIYNTLGQLMQVIANPNETIDVSNLRTGNYVIKILSEKGSSTSKFIKE
ncbi:DUF7619 domain-containing protein [Flavobacterium sp. 25HG05S-40]|uniref:DUF7619 domain-containing protein n=1 Tax=Flavobacterium sp. 25HG05S-40 TaxID=3458682 RepID=UPI0040450768